MEWLSNTGRDGVRGREKTARHSDIPSQVSRFTDRHPLSLLLM